MHQAQDAFHRLAGELLDVCGCQPDIHICLPQKGFRDGAAVGKRSVMVPGRLRRGMRWRRRSAVISGSVYRREPWLHLVGGVARWWSAAAYRDAAVVQGA